MIESHKIWRQVLDIQLSENNDAYNVQSKIRDVYYDQLMPLIEQKLNEIYTGDDTLVFDRLEFDLGELKLQEFDQLAPRRLEQKLSEISISFGFEIRNDLIKEKGTATSFDGSKIEWKKNTARKSEFEALITFLERGILPWTKNRSKLNQKSLDRFVEELMIQQAIEISAFVNRNLHSLAIQQRIVHHFSEKTIREILTINFSKKIKLDQFEIVQLLKEIAQLLGIKELTQTDKAKTIWLNLHINLLSLKNGNIEQLFLPNVIKTVRLEFPNLKHSPIQLIERLISKKNDYPQLIAWYAKSGIEFKELENIIQLKIKSKSTTQKERITAKGDQLILSEWQNARKNMLTFGEQLSQEYKKSVDEWLNELALTAQIQSHSDEKVVEKPNDAADNSRLTGETIKKVIVEDGVSINNAGLIIVAYFLPFLFRHFEWIDENGVIKPSDIPKALAISQFIALGTEIVDESQLLLNKLLLGLDPEEVITNDYKLSPEEKEESENLLSNVISKWKSLGSTSNDGLRQTFFQRNGILYEREENYTLVVERKSLDILMDQLPWSIGIIKLSWMPKIIVVEW